MVNVVLEFGFSPHWLVARISSNCYFHAHFRETRFCLNVVRGLFRDRDRDRERQRAVTSKILKSKKFIISFSVYVVIEGRSRNQYWVRLGSRSLAFISICVKCVVLTAQVSCSTSRLMNFRAQAIFGAIRNDQSRDTHMSIRPRLLKIDKVKCLVLLRA